MAPLLYREKLDARQHPEEYDGELWQALRQMRSPDENVRVEHRLVEGNAAKKIVEVAEQIQAGLIVMATHGRSGLGRALLGSVAEQVMRKAPCPVLTVRSNSKLPGLSTRQRSAEP